MDPALPNDVIIGLIHSLVASSSSCNEWLPLRLVSRFFNQELLFALFVIRIGPQLPDYDRTAENAPYLSETRKTFLSTQDFIDRNPRHDYQYQYFQRLVTSWWLQGQIFRTSVNDNESLVWINAVQGATKSFDEWVALPSSATSKLKIMSAKSSSLGSVQGSPHLSKTTELACDALICLFGPQNLSQTIFDPPTKSKAQGWTSSFVLHLMCCLVGDVPAIENSIRFLTLQNLRKDVQVVLCGLMIAARQGHLDAVQYLLESDIIRPNWGYACNSGIVPAVESGNIAMLNLFLRPQYGMYLCGSQLERAIIVAAEFPDPTIRLNLVSQLLSDAVHDKLRLRHLVLATACKINDLSLAELTVKGWSPLTMAYENFGLLHPLQSACHYRRPEILRLLFDATNQNRGESYRSAVDKWFLWTISQRYSELFVEFLPHMEWIDTHELMIKASAMEDALPTLETLWGASDFMDKVQEPHQKLTCGFAMLSTAVHHGSLRNVEWLLSRGVRTSEPVRLFHDLDEANFTVYQRIDKLLKEANNPGLEICPRILPVGR